MALQAEPTTRNRVTSPPPILGSFVERLAARDFDGVAACLDPDIRFRAIIPPGPEEQHGRTAATGRFGDWFAGAFKFELAEHRIEPFVDRWLVTYRIDLDEGEGPRRVEQHLFCDLGTELIERIDLLCSGFRPVVLPTDPRDPRYVRKPPFGSSSLPAGSEILRSTGRGSQARPSQRTVA